MYCRKCGEKISDQATYCPKCGSLINERQEQRSSEHCEIQYAKQGNRKHKVIGIITVVAIIVVVAIVVFALFGGKK